MTELSLSRTNRRSRPRFEISDRSTLIPGGVQVRISSYDPAEEPRRNTLIRARGLDHQFGVALVEADHQNPPKFGTCRSRPTTVHSFPTRPEIKQGGDIRAFDLPITMAVTCSPTAPSFAAQTGWRFQIPSWTWMSSSATRPWASR